jgi:hypothetical protein
MRRSLHALLGIVSVIGMLVVTPGIAHAAASDSAARGWRFPYGDDACSPEFNCHASWGQFKADPGTVRRWWNHLGETAPGDALRACDNEPDGWGVRARMTWESNSTPHLRVRTVSTQGHASPYCTGWKTGNIAEGKKIHLKVCLVRGDETKACKKDTGRA